MALNQSQIEALDLKLALAARDGKQVTLTPAQVRWVAEKLDELISMPSSFRHSCK